VLGLGGRLVCVRESERDEVKRWGGGERIYVKQSLMRRRTHDDTLHP